MDADFPVDQIGASKQTKSASNEELQHLLFIKSPFHAALAITFKTDCQQNFYLNSHADWYKLYENRRKIQGNAAFLCSYICMKVASTLYLFLKINIHGSLHEHDRILHVLINCYFATLKLNYHLFLDIRNRYLLPKIQVMFSVENLWKFLTFTKRVSV